MRRANASCRIDSIHVVDAVIQVRADSTMMEADYALLGHVSESELSESGLTKRPPLLHAKNKAYTRNWSPQTLELLYQLLESMENDLLSQHFEVSAPNTTKEESDAQGLEPGGHEGAPQF